MADEFALRCAPPPPEGEPEDLPALASRPRASAPLGADIPSWARQWRARAPGSGACVRVSERGVELSYHDERADVRVAAYLPFSKYPTDNAMAFAAASGAVRFAPVQRAASAEPAHPPKQRFAFAKSKTPSPEEPPPREPPREPGAFPTRRE